MTEKFEHESIAEVSEARLVEMLLRDSYWFSTVFCFAGMPRDSHDYSCVDLKGIPPFGATGDIDVLRFPVGQPELATAIQAKRIKVSAKSLRTGQPNKLSDLSEGIRQTNHLSDLGFHQVYLYLLIEVDSRERNAGKFSFDGSTMEVKSLIQRHVSTVAAKLRPIVGLCEWEFTQSMDAGPLGAGGFRGHLVRLAQQKKQSDELTRWVSSATANLAPFGTKSIY